MPKGKTAESHEPNTEQPSEGPPTEEPEVMAVAILKDKHMYRTVKLILPQSLVQKHATIVWEPDFYSLAVRRASTILETIYD